MVTVNELFAVFVSVPVNVADPAVGMVPTTVGTKLTLTVMVCPPGRDAVRHVITPPNEPGAGVTQTPPAFVEAEVNWKEEGIVLVNTTAFATTLWLSFTCQVNVSAVP